MARKTRIGLTMKIFPRPMFQSIIAEHLSLRDVNYVMLAYRLAKYGHRGQERDDHTRYFDHTKGTALIFMIELGIFDSEILIMSLLHDIEEDSFILTYWDIELLFGKKVCNGIQDLTKQEGKDYFGKLLQANWKAQLVKLAERLHNLRSLKAFSLERKQKYLLETEHFFFPLAEKVIYHVPPQFRDAARYLRDEINRACSLAKKTI